MKITPNLLSPTPLPSDPDRKVGALRPTNPSRDVLDGADTRKVPIRPMLASPEQKGTAGQIETMARPVAPGQSARANRALVAYADVADGPERSRLRSLLGFDDYA